LPAAAWRPASRPRAPPGRGRCSQIAAGENAGRLLTHDFVARDWLELGHLDAAGRLEARPTLPDRSDAKLQNTGLVALLEDPASGRILQAAALPYCPPR
jgi:hypothetical protein